MSSSSFRTLSQYSFTASWISSSETTRSPCAEAEEELLEAADDDDEEEEEEYAVAVAVVMGSPWTSLSSSVRSMSTGRVSLFPRRCWLMLARWLCWKWRGREWNRVSKLARVRQEGGRVGKGVNFES